MKRLFTIIILIISLWHPKPKCDRNKGWEKRQIKTGCITIFGNEFCNFSGKTAKSSCDDLTIGIK